MTIGRREFLAGLGGVGAGLGLGAVSHWLPLAPPETGPAWSARREESVSSTCTLCPSHCGIRGRLVDGNLIRIDGNPLHPVSRGGLCPKGAAGIQLLYHPGRITGPVERVGPPGTAEFRRISWDDALGRVAGKLAELRANGRSDRMVWVAGDVTGLLGEMQRRFAGAVGTRNLVTEDYADGSSRVLELTQGIGAQPAFDLESSDLVLSFGAALSEAWWCLPQASRARDAEAGRRPRWIQADTRHSRTAARSDQWIPVRPGTYGLLAIGIAYVLFKEGLFDTQSTAGRVTGIDDWQGPDGDLVPGFRSLVLKHGRTEQISRQTGVAPEALVRVAKAFGRADRPVAIWDQAVSWRTGGLADAMCIHSLNILIGALDRRGGVLVQPALPVPALDGIEAGGRAAGPALAAGDWIPRVAETGGSEVEVIFMHRSNPVGSSPDSALAAKALERTPLVVSFSPFLDESAKYAHIVLPDHVYLERWEDAPAPASVPIPVWGIVQPVVAPLHDTRSTGDLILDIARRIGGEVAEAFPWTRTEELVEARGKALAGARRGGAFVQSFRRGELRELEARGWWLPHNLPESEFWETLRERGGWFDPYYDYDDRSVVSGFPDGRVRVFSGEARAEIAGSGPDLTEGFLPHADAGSEHVPLTLPYPLRLIPYRVSTLASGGTALMPYLLENLGVLTGDTWEAWVEINPETGHELGLVSGQMVRVESESGAFVARMKFFAGAQPGTLGAPYGLHTVVEGWGRCRSTNPLAAVGGRREPTTGMPDWYSTRVRVIPV